MKKLLVIMLAVLLALSAAAVAEEADPTIEEGYRNEMENCTSEVRWCRNGDGMDGGALLQG